MPKKDRNTLLEVRNLKKYFPVKKQFLRAVDDVSFSIEKGETMGLVGESGCGKSTTARTIIRLYNPDGGEIIFDNINIASMTQRQLIPYRRRMQMIFQNPYSSLNERMTVRDIIGEPLAIHEKYSPAEKKDTIHKLLKRVGLSPSHANRYPHEFSGGQRQRIGIARAISLNPDFIICDEPISALDVSIQAQIVNMLEDLQEEMGLTYLFIAHDLSMVRHISDKMAVMYLGRIIELAESEELYTNPLHPYTKALLAASPVPDPRVKKKGEVIVGDVPSPMDIPSGCRFRTRCPYAMEICKSEEPELTGTDHRVACYLHK